MTREITPPLLAPPPRPPVVTLLGIVLIILGVASGVTMIWSYSVAGRASLDPTFILFPVLGIGVLNGKAGAQGCLSLIAIVLLVAGAMHLAKTVLLISETLPHSTTAEDDPIFPLALATATPLFLGFLIWKALYSKKSKIYFNYREELTQQQFALHRTKNHPPRTPIIPARPDPQNKKSESENQS